MINAVKQIRKERIAILTNSSLLDKLEVQRIMIDFIMERLICFKYNLDEMYNNIL